MYQICTCIEEFIRHRHMHTHKHRHTHRHRHRHKHRQIHTYQTAEYMCRIYIHKLVYSYV